jgi:CheY-like chemotaxis protein
MVQADATRLVQVFVNLLSNAANYTPQGGAVALVCEVDGDEAVVSVRDSGVGIDPALRASIFDLFVQGSRPLDRRQGGLGIGLTVARALVRMHGGSIAVHSEGTGGGSTFVVRLPLLQSQMAATAAPEQVPVSQRSGLRILVVDDNTDAAESLAVILDQWGYEAEVVADGMQAIARWHTFQPDAVLLDIGLPGMSGYELARHLRLLPRGSDVLLVAITGYGQGPDRQLSYQAGIDVHLTKPVELDALQRTLSQHLKDNAQA